MNFIKPEDCTLVLHKASVISKSYVTVLLLQPVCVQFTVWFCHLLQHWASAAITHAEETSDFGIFL